MLIEQRAGTQNAAITEKPQVVLFNPYKKVSRSIDKVGDLKDSTGARAYSITKAPIPPTINFQDGVANQLSNQRPKMSKLSLTTFLKARQKKNSTSFSGVSTGGQDQSVKNLQAESHSEAVRVPSPLHKFQEGQLLHNPPRLRPHISSIQMPQSTSLFSSLAGIMKKTRSRANSRSMSRDATEEVSEQPVRPSTASMVQKSVTPQSPASTVLGAGLQRPLMPRTPSQPAPFAEAGLKYPAPPQVGPKVRAEDIDSMLRTSLNSKHSRLSSLAKHLPNFMRSSSTKGALATSGTSPTMSAPTYYTRHMLLHLRYEHSKSGHRARQHFREVFAHLLFVKSLRKPSDETLIKSQFRCIPNDALSDGKKSRRVAVTQKSSP